MLCFLPRQLFCRLKATAPKMILQEIKIRIFSVEKKNPEISIRLRHDNFQHLMERLIDQVFFFSIQKIARRDFSPFLSQ